MVELDEFKKLLLRGDLTRTEFLPISHRYYNEYKKGEVRVFYEKGLLTEIMIGDKPIEDFFFLPECGDGEDALYYRITDEAIEWLYNRLITVYLRAK